MLIAFAAWQQAGLRRTSPPGTFTVFVEAGEAVGDGATDDILKTAHGIMTGLLVRFDPLVVQTELIELSAEHATAAYRLTIDTTVDAAGDTELTLSLNHLDDDQPIWSRRGNWTDDNAQNELFLESAVSELASGYGVLVRNQLLNRRGEYSPGLLCLAHAAEFQRTREASMIAPLEQCLTASIKAYPKRPALYRDALSFLLYAKVERDPSALYARAQGRKLAEEAFALAGMDSAVANFAMARSYFFERDCYAGSRQLRAAVSKNPADGERMAFGGTYLFICKNPAAKAMLERAVALDGDRASVALVVLAFFELRRNDGAAALALVDRVVPSLQQEPQIDLTRAAALYELGRRNEAFATMAKLRKRIGADDKMTAERFLGHFISNPQTIKILAVELRKRGLQP